MPCKRLIKNLVSDKKSCSRQEIEASPQFYFFVLLPRQLCDYLIKTYLVRREDATICTGRAVHVVDADEAKCSAPVVPHGHQNERTLPEPFLAISVPKEDAAVALHSRDMHQLASSHGIKTVVTYQDKGCFTA